MTFNEVKTLAVRLGGQVESGGINWTWARDFPNEAAAKEFCSAVEAVGYETRGVYPPVDNGNPNINNWGVRFR